MAFSLPINITAENLFPPVQLRFDLMKVSVVLAIFTKRPRYLYNEVKNVENQNTMGLLEKKIFRQNYHTTAIKPYTDNFLY